MKKHLFLKSLLIAIGLLITSLTTQVWAGAGFYEAYISYSYNGTSGDKTCTSSGTETTELGTLTADFKITSIYLKNWKNGSGDICGGLVEYYIDSDKEYQPSWSWSDLGWYDNANHPQLGSTAEWKIAQYNSGASGSYTFWYRFKVWGGGNGGCSTNYYIPTDGSSKNKFTYNIAPPAVNSFAVSTTGSNILSGTGTSEDPYIIAYNGSLVLSLSGSKGRIDANSSLQYNTSGTWNTTTSRTISSIKSTTKTSVTVKMRCYNSTASLSGTESSKEIFYKSETPYTITVQADNTGYGSVSPSTVYTKGDVASESFTASVPVADAAKYEFVDWSATSGVTLQSSASSATNTVKSTGNGTVTANFQKKQYSITYSPVSASHCTYTTTPANARYGNTVNLQIDPDDNYVISSVTAVDASSNTVTVSGSEPNYSFTMPASNVTVTVVTALSSITVNYGAGSNGSLAAKQSGSSIGDSGSTVDGGSTVNFIASPNTGYEVEGWYESYSAGVFSDKIDAAGTSTTYDVVANSTLNVYVKFQLSTYDIHYENMTGATNHGDNPATYQYTTSTITLQDPSKTGYRFDGWFSDNGVWENEVTSIPQYSTGDVTIYAKWTAKSYDVSLNANGGTGAGVTVSATYDAAMPTRDKSSAALVAPTRAGYTFAGYYDDPSSGTKYYNANLTSARTWNKTSNTTLYAHWTARPYKIVYFAMPQGWTNVYAYAWKSSDDTKKNANWPGVQLNNSAAGTGSVIENGVTYYYYKYYTDGLAGDSEGNGTGNNKEPGNWNYLKFNNGSGGTEGSTETRRVNISTGHYYWLNEAQGSTGTSAAAVWYVKGAFPSHSWDTHYPISFASDSRSGSVLIDGLTASTSYSFKIYLAKANGEWYKYTGGPDATYDADYNITSEIGTELTLRTYNNSNNTFTTATTSYRFSLDVTNINHPVLTVAPGTDNDYSATLSIHEDGHGTTTPSAGGITLHQYTPTSITANPQPGYRFKQWNINANVSYAAGSSSTSNPASFLGTANGGTIEAEFTQEGIIYFDNTMSQWKGDIYVYLFTMDKKTRNPWWETMDPSSNGPGIVLKKKDGTVMYQYSGKMIRIGESNIYYFNYKDAGCSSTVYQAVFTKGDFSTSAGLHKTSAAYRADFNACMPMYIASQTWTTTNETGYHNAGYWKRYNVKNSGLTLRGSWNDWSSGGEIEFTSTEENSNTFKASVTLGNATHQFKIYRPCVNGSGWLGNTGTMQPSNSTGWEMTETDNCHIYIPSTGTYVFTLNLGTDHIYLSVEYPLLQNDYRLLHSGRITTSGSDGHKHPSQSVRHLTGNNKEQRDTVSFFIDKDHKGTLYLQKCTNPAGDGGRGTWADSAAVTVSLSDINKTGVYNFEIVQTTNGSGKRTVTANILDAGHRKYDGNLYIRTDVADGGWDAYEKVNDNVLIFTEYAKSHSNYDHYHCHWTPTGKNLHFTIATDYSPSISDTMKTGAAPFNFETLPYEASVRFMYNSATNELNRAYLNGANEGEAEYLKIQAMNDSIRQNAAGSPPLFPAGNHSGDTVFVKFKDLGNWVYQYELKAIEGTHYRLVSNYRYSSKDHLQYFKGSAGTWNASTTEPLLGGSGATWQKLRLVYDFKTNNLIAAWMPDGDVGSDLAIHADMMLIRRAQNAATQLTFTSGKKLSDVKTMVGAIEFFKDSIVGRVNNFSGDVIGTKGNRANRELMLYISFPFDVAVNDIYGCGDYNKEWYIQYYDGAERASKGWFKGDGTTTFWKFIDRSDTLRAGVGYSLLLDNDYFNTDNAGVWKNIADGGSVYLFFPSAKELDGSKVIKTGDAALTVPSHECTIDRTFVSENSGRTVNHKFTDSHWNMMGVPLFQNETGVGIDQFIPKIDKEDEQELIPFPANTGYFYEWDSLRNTLSVRTTSGYTFKSMHGYMVQFTGTVGFSGSSIQPASPVAARRTKLNRDNYTIELQLLQNNNRVSRTYVELREEACDTFALNEDVYMMYSALPANLYTFAGNYDVSANVLSVNDHTIPVGITVRNAGTYTFTMPSDFNGSVTLIDNVENTRTNLALSDYEVTLPKGVCEGRFSVEIGIHKVPTSIDVIEDGGSLKDGKAHKFIMNDQMYIIKNGVIYDAQGKRVK